MLKTFNTYPCNIVEADQYHDFATTRLANIAVFGGVLSVHPEVFAEDPDTIGLSEMDFNVSALRAATLSIGKIVGAARIEESFIRGGTTRMRKRLQVAANCCMFAHAFFDHGFFRVAQATKKLGIDTDDRDIVQDVINGVSFQDIADERKVKKSKVVGRIDKLKHTVSASQATELALYLMMSGELHNRLGPDTLPPAKDNRPLYFEAEQIPLAAPVLLSAAQHGQFTHADVMQAMNQHQ